MAHTFLLLSLLLSHSPTAQLGPALLWVAQLMSAGEVVRQSDFPQQYWIFSIMALVKQVPCATVGLWVGGALQHRNPELKTDLSPGSPTQQQTCFGLMLLHLLNSLL